MSAEAAFAVLFLVLAYAALVGAILILRHAVREATQALAELNKHDRSVVNTDDMYGPFRAALRRVR